MYETANGLHKAGTLDAMTTRVRRAVPVAQQGALSMEPVCLRRESHPRIDTIGGQSTRVYDDVEGQCNHMEYLQLNAALSVF